MKHSPTSDARSQRDIRTFCVKPCQFIDDAAHLARVHGGDRHQGLHHRRRVRRAARQHANVRSPVTSNYTRIHDRHLLHPQRAHRRTARPVVQPQRRDDHQPATEPRAPIDVPLRAQAVARRPVDGGPGPHAALRRSPSGQAQGTRRGHECPTPRRRNRGTRRRVGDRGTRRSRCRHRWRHLCDARRTTWVRSAS